PTPPGYPAGNFYPGTDLDGNPVVTEHTGPHPEVWPAFPEPSATLLPLVTFIAAAFVSFATGTSWGTMGILCPAVVSIGARLFGGMPEDQALMLFYATIGAVLTGAVFGDHCSPISDTTVLSSIASECDLGKHVWTQMPYALVVAVVGILCTDLLSVGLDRWAGGFLEANRGWVIYLGTATGMLLLLLIVRIAGRRPAT
ncbi:MAG: hypothetical protein GY778_00610, partial [bacterium]|nr:hypothetical protein [bacterium]